MFVVFDTETTGLPKNWKAPVTDLDNWPRIIQLAFAIYAEDGKKIHSFSSLIKPNGWTVPKEKFWIEHGYTTEACEANGVDLTYAITELKLAIDQYPYLVAHNIEFDRMIVGAEMIRTGIFCANKPKQICTKLASTQYCKIPSQHGHGYKWPKLEELYMKLFGTSFQGAHDAGNDVQACAESLFELIKIGIIKL